MYNFKPWMTSSKGSKACNLRDKTSSEINHLQFVCIRNLLVFTLLLYQMRDINSTSRGECLGLKKQAQLITMHS